ncbi:hypothetical protein PV10_00977 [Exophiala mesophila]|uniref:Major facilitator superfamily (MFS) profile domain-containing protein n=1 Tax=Exophiala mesophila TaxID=212818 RepID=A0A0D1X5Y0_EXOME|nr:uncharacterized protein PV10_00977 [Exophiala mesophila]KIV97200.1 hypothetical protein PV10_00977 [Exophiala mesophila]
MNSDLENEKGGSVPIGGVEVENHAGPRVVDLETEKKILRKLDIRIIPMVMWIYLMNFMDRVNIGNARLYGLEEDLGMQGDQFQLAVSILFVTYCIFEAPSNLVIKRLQPARYLAGLMFAWGIVATFTAFVNNLGALIACRLLLGLFEAGLFPGVIVYLTIFYSKRSIALRTAYFFSMAAASGACGGFVAYAIGFIDGAAGWRAWRWIILINGIPTVLTAFLVPFVLPNSVETASFLTEEDKANMILIREAEIGSTSKAQQLHWEDVKAGLLDWKTYLFSVGQFSINTMVYSFSVFLPTIIRGLGTWSTAEVQALTIPVFALGAIVYLTCAWASDRLQQRGIFVVGASITAIIGYCLLVSNYNNATSFAGCFFVSMGCFTAAGSALVWLNSNNPRWGKRAVSSGMQLSIANAAGVSAPFLFSNKYAPSYIPGYAASIGLLGLQASLHTFIWFYWRRANSRKLAGKEDWRMEGLTEEEISELGEHNPRYIYST